MKTISPVDLQMLIEKGEIELIDVRPKEDFEKIHALSARSIPLSGFEPHSVLAHRKLDRHAPLYLICRRKTLASLAACGLTGAGLEEPIVVDGGLESWEKQGLPVVRKKFFQRPRSRPACDEQSTRNLVRQNRQFTKGRSWFFLALFLTASWFPGNDVVRAGHLAASKPSTPPWRREMPVAAYTEIERGPRGRSQIALTFDAGANAECFEDLIAALERARVHSTFFITGNWTERNVECAKAITKHGHEIGNHTWNHLDLTKYSDEIVREEIMYAEQSLTAITGQTPQPYWRAPFGARNERVLRIAASLGYRSIYWTIDSLDSMEPRKTREFLIDRVTSKSDAQLDGAIILMHVGMKSTADALSAIIANLQGRGFQLVTISTLLGPGSKLR